MSDRPWTRDLWSAAKPILSALIVGAALLAAFYDKEAYDLLSVPLGAVIGFWFHQTQRAEAKTAQRQLEGKKTP